MTPPVSGGPREKLFQPGANMYGCLPCPKCGGDYRVPYMETHSDPTYAGKIVCEDCGYRAEYEPEDA